MLLTHEVLARAYMFLCTTPPFEGWNLPDADDVLFKVGRTTSHYGEYRMVGEKHLIMVSSGKVAHLTTLFETMAHEMIHLFLGETKQDRNDVEHSAAFYKLRDRVAKQLGFDPKRL